MARRAAAASLAFAGLVMQAVAQTGQETPYLTPESLERTGPPFSPFSIHNFFAILKRCEVVAPDRAAVAARAAAFERLLDRARTNNGLWRTFTDAQGRLAETRFASARAMFASAEFAADVQRYHAHVAAIRLSVMLDDCQGYESLVAQALGER